MTLSCYMHFLNGSLKNLDDNQKNLTHKYQNVWFEYKTNQIRYIGQYFFQIQVIQIWTIIVQIEIVQKWATAAGPETGRAIKNRKVCLDGSRGTA